MFSHRTNVTGEVYIIILFFYPLLREHISNYYCYDKAVTEFADESQIKLICVCFVHHSHFYRNRVIGFTVYLQVVYSVQNHCSGFFVPCHDVCIRCFVFVFA